MGKAPRINASFSFIYSILEAIAYSPDCFNKIAGVSELLPESYYLYVDGSVCHGIVVTAYRVYDLITCKDPSGPLGESGEHFKLCVRKRCYLSLYHDLSLTDMNFHVIIRDNVFLLL